MAAADAAFLRSASSQMIIGSLPPSSSVVRLEPTAASAATRSPVGVEPVKATLRTSGCVTSASPVTGPVPVTTLNTPSGRISLRISCRRSVVNGVVSAGFATTVLPHSSAGPSLLQSSVVGKFHGTIAATTPSGRRSTRPSTPGIEPVDVDAADLLGEPRVVLERLGGLVQLDLRLADRLALLGDEDRHQLVHMRLERLRARVQQLAAVGVAAARPVAEGLVRHAHRDVDGLGVGGLDLADRLPGRRVDDGQHSGIQGA